MKRELYTAHQKDEYQNWMDAAYPYDIAPCGNCATQHSLAACKLPEHAEMRQEAKRLGFNDGVQRRIGPRMRKRILAFREKFAQLYNAVVQP